MTAAGSAPAERAYNVLAPVYDEQVAGDQWMRRLLWARYDALFRHGDHVLDLGCGTGTDLLYLARRGMHVTGVDVSAGMLARAREKIDRSGMAQAAHIELRDLNDSGDLGPARFDGVITSFAALNTVESPRSLAAALAGVVRPGGHMIAHVLNRRSLREWVGLLAHGRLARAHALKHQRERVFVLSGVAVRHRLWHGMELYEEGFEPFFELERMYALGIFRSTEQRQNSGGSGSWLGRLDARAGGTSPFVNWGRWVVLEMVRKPRH